MKKIFLFVLICISCTPIIYTQIHFERHVIDVPITTDPVSIDLKDMDGDNDIDIVCASFRDCKISWFENRVGVFDTQHIVSLYANDYPTTLFAGDLDGDGDNDIVAGFLGMLGN